DRYPDLAQGPRRGRSDRPALRPHRHRGRQPHDQPRDLQDPRGQPGDLEGHRLGDDHLLRRDLVDPHGAVRVRRDRRRRVLAPDVAHHAARAGARHLPAAHPHRRQRADRRLRAAAAAAARRRRERRPGAGHLRLLPRHRGRRLGAVRSGWTDQGRHRHHPRHLREPDREAPRNRRDLLMAVVDQIARPDMSRPAGPRARRAAAGRPPWMDRPSPTMQALKVVVIAMIALVMLYPFLYVIMFSFADGRSVTSGQLIPTSFSTAAYESIFAGGVVTRSLLVTAGVTIVGTLLSLLFTSMLAYGLTRTRDVPFAKGAMVLVLCTMF